MKESSQYPYKISNAFYLNILTKVSERLCDENSALDSYLPHDTSYTKKHNELLIKLYNYKDTLTQNNYYITL